MTGDLLLTGGTVYTMDDDCSASDALLIRDGEVVALGDAAETAAGEDVRTLELDGATVLPGFNDAHAHVPSVGMTLYETDLAAAGTREEAFELLADNAADTDAGEWVLGYAYDESTWPEGERDYLTREELDAVSEEHPVFVQRVDGHTVSLNAAGLDAVDFAGVEQDVRTDDGDPTGVVVEDAAVRAKEAVYPDPEKARVVLGLALDRAAELGITSIQDMAGMTTPDDPGDPAHAAFHAAWRDGDLPVRLGYYVHLNRGGELSTLELASGFGDDRLRVLGLKVFSDGAIGSQTAKLSGAFRDDPGNDGQFVIDPQEMESAFRAAARADQAIATHAIGDEAIDAVLDAYEAVRDDYDVPDPRLRIEHVELATDEAIERMAELDVVASMQPNFLQWSGPDGLYETRLGETWRRSNNRFRDVLDAGVPLAFGSDTMPLGPLYGISHAVTADHDCQRLSVEEAVRAYTEGAAHAELAADRKGRLVEGMLGDAVVLDADPFEVPEAIDDIDVLATVVGGEVVYADDERGPV